VHICRISRAGIREIQVTEHFSYTIPKFCESVKYHLMTVFGLTMISADFRSGRICESQAKLSPKCNFYDGTYFGLQSFHYVHAPILAISILTTVIRPKSQAHGCVCSTNGMTPLDC
jgi:hypothetical protein